MPVDDEPMLVERRSPPVAPATVVAVVDVDAKVAGFVAFMLAEKLDDAET